MLPEDLDDFVKDFFKDNYKFFHDSSSNIIFLWTCGHEVVKEKMAAYPDHQIILVEKSFFDNVKSFDNSLTITDNAQNEPIGVSPDCECQ